MGIYQNSEDESMKQSCNICGKQVLTKKKLKQHQDAVHRNKGFKCTECDHWYKTRSSLSQNIGAVHDGVNFMGHGFYRTWIYSTWVMGRYLESKWISVNLNNS